MSWEKHGGGNTSNINTIEDISNVKIDTLNDGQGIFFDQTTQKWKNRNMMVGSNTKKMMVSFIFDDTQKRYYDNLNIFTSRNITFTTALRQDFLGSAGGGLTWDMVKAIQDAGNEIAYHGMHHNYTGEQQYIDENDVQTYINNTNLNGICINGWVGPNGDYYDDLIFHTYKNIFKWARGGGNTGVANVGEPVDYFKHIPSNFIDDLTSDSALTTLKSKIDNLVNRGTGFLVLCNHWSDSNTPYLEQIIDYIISKGIEIKTVSETYKTYGAVYEFIDSSLTIDDFIKRKSGNGGTTNNPSSPHFIMQEDGNLISNNAMFKLINTTKGTTVYNGTTISDDFDIGVNVIQYGSSDNHTNLPNTGTLYTFNFGKSYSEQFQLYKAYNNGGLHFRESDTSGNWKTTTFTDKLSVFRSTKPTSSTSIGSKGDWSADTNYLYVCYLDNNWIRIAKDSTWT